MSSRDLIYNPYIHSSGSYNEYKMPYAFQIYEICSYVIQQKIKIEVWNLNFQKTHERKQRRHTFL